MAIRTPQQLLTEAEQCVKCGLCLPYCPTYQLERNESESPRGRIALIQGLAAGMLKRDDAGVGDSLDHCLTCRLCESNCPSGVRYGEIIDAARTIYGTEVPRRLADMLSKPASIVTSVGRLAGRRGLGHWLPEGLNRRLLEVAKYSNKPEKLEQIYPSRTEPVGSVMFFTGCQGITSELQAIKSAIELLTLCGYSVSLQQQQTCCGAIHQHAGYREEATVLRESNRQLFHTKNCDAVVSISSGCRLQLVETVTFDVPVKDPMQLVVERLPEHRLTGPGESKRRIGIYIPCTQQQLGDGSVMRNLLQKLHDIETVELKGLGCCGAAGINLLLHPQQSERVAAPLIEEVRAANIECLVTSNVGCALHLREQLEKHGLPILVKHPLELVAEAYR